MNIAFMADFYRSIIRCLLQALCASICVHLCRMIYARLYYLLWYWRYTSFVSNFNIPPKYFDANVSDMQSKYTLRRRIESNEQRRRGINRKGIRVNENIEREISKWQICLYMLARTYGTEIRKAENKEKKKKYTYSLINSN